MTWCFTLFPLRESCAININIYNAFCFDVLKSQLLYLFNTAHCPKFKGLPVVFYTSTISPKSTFKQSWGKMLMCSHFKSTLGSFFGRRLWLEFDWSSLGTCSIDYEIQRQMEVLQSDGTVLNETRAFDSKSG